MHSRYHTPNAILHGRRFWSVMAAAALKAMHPSAVLVPWSRNSVLRGPDCLRDMGSIVWCDALDFVAQEHCGIYDHRRDDVEALLEEMYPQRNRIHGVLSTSSAFAILSKANAKMGRFHEISNPSFSLTLNTEQNIVGIMSGFGHDFSNPATNDFVASLFNAALADTPINTEFEWVSAALAGLEVNDAPRLIDLVAGVASGKPDKQRFLNSAGQARLELAKRGGKEQCTTEHGYVVVVVESESVMNFGFPNWYAGKLIQTGAPGVILLGTEGRVEIHTGQGGLALDIARRIRPQGWALITHKHAVGTATAGRGPAPLSLEAVLAALA